MDTTYTKIDGWCGMSIEDAVKLLRQYHAEGKKACMEFNGATLYSDTVTVESAYLEIVGCTKAEFDQRQKERREQYAREEREHKQKIPELTKEWIEKGHAVLDEKYWASWDECVPVRLGDLYRGMELGQCLDIVDHLNKGCSMRKAQGIINNQGHSGMSYGLVRVMVKSFCDRGEEFFEHTAM